MSDPERDIDGDGVDVGDADVDETFDDDEIAGKLDESNPNFEGEDAHDFMEELPQEVKRRVKALKKIQVDVTKIEAKFYEEMHALECKYLPLYQPLFDKRRLITAGEYEPNEEECEFMVSETDEIVEAVGKLNLTTGKESVKVDETKEKVPGIPDFWLRIFHNVEMLDEMVETYDEPIIKHLTDIQVEMTNQPMGFKLLFHFSPNEYFSNPVLVKSYEMRCDLDAEDPFSFEGPEIVKCTGCEIDWQKGKNVTVKTIRKKQKHKQRGSIRTVSKTIEAQSFFNFFSPPQVSDEPLAEMDEETQMRLTNDFEVGQYIRERIVPRAILYYTGEALEEDFEEEEEEGSDEEEEEEAEMVVPNNRAQRNSRKSQAQKSPQECKQQ